MQVTLLMRVHHRNLTSLVGYLNEGNHLGLIYEYMANGDLAEHLSGKLNDNELHNTTYKISLNLTLL